FITLADKKFGPMTTKRRGPGERPIKIPWAAARLSDEDWERVRLCCDILADANLYQQTGSSSSVPTLHRVIPALETISSRWEAKEKNSKFQVFRNALRAALEKLLKYYKHLDDACAYILALYLHPYYKLLYIKEQWGGEAEFHADLLAGIEMPRNWQAYAREVVETALRKVRQIEWDADIADDTHPPHVNDDDDDDDDGDSYDRARRRRLQSADSDDGWKIEMRWYEDDPALNVTKDVDTTAYWAVRPPIPCTSSTLC
ncbi:hypothetical protein L227DRAFT_514341, partial [Lentinus tigrinus ALCF2SS1-6]